jgi:hypothetical protein
MMRFLRSFQFLAPVFLVSVFMFPAISVAAPGGWEPLGTLDVTDRLDHDTLPVTRAQGTFKAVRLKVLKHAVQFHSMKIHFSNGDVQNVELRDVIPAGGKSRIIDVDGFDRGIKSIEFSYDAQTLRGRHAKVRVFGRN